MRVLFTTLILGSVCLSFSSDTVTPKTPATKKRIPMVKRQRSVVSASSDRAETRKHKNRLAFPPSRLLTR